MTAGLMVLKLHEAIHIEALPADIPGEIEIDISLLTLERPITIADLPQVKGVTFVDDAEEVLSSTSRPRVKRWPKKPPSKPPSRKLSRRASRPTGKKSSPRKLGVTDTGYRQDARCFIFTTPLLLKTASGPPPPRRRAFPSANARRCSGRC